VIIVGLHLAMNTADTLWCVGDFNIATLLRFQAGRLRQVGVE
jgi:hypothetical protein